MKTIKIAACLVLLIQALILPAAAAPAPQAGSPVGEESVAASWQSAPALPQALAALGAVVASERLITLGGQNATGATGTPVADIYKSVIGSGSPGGWSGGGSLDRKTAGQGVAMANGRVYLIGGRSGEEAGKDVRFAQPDHAGNLGNWRQTEALPKRSSLAGVAVSGNFIYLAGGWDGGEVREEVFYSVIGAGGVLGDWESAFDLPVAVRSLTLTAANGYLYAIGGADGNNTASAQVYRAKINANGSLTSWQPLTDRPLPQARERHATVVYGGRLVVLGGLNASGNSTNTVYAATLNADGSLGAWQTGFLPSLLQPLDRHAAVVANVAGCGEVIYVVGGRNGDAYQNTVYNTTCTAAPRAKTYVPLVPNGVTDPPEIYGRITQMGAGVPNVAVELHYFDGTQWGSEPLQKVTTNAAGNYSFLGVPLLSSGQMYNVAFANAEKNNTRLAYVQSFVITTFSGGRLSGGDLEVQNLTHSSPAQDASVTLPATFCWHTRGVSGDTYFLVLQDLDTGDWYWYAAGSSTCFELDELPPGFQYGKAYGWSIGVENDPADNYEWGLSYYYQKVTFQAGGVNSIYGHATQSQAAVSGVRIDLDYFSASGSSWSTRAYVSTDSSGKYDFVDQPALASGDIYNAAYYNKEGNNTRLGYCQKAYMTSYAGGTVWGGDFELQNVVMQSPGGGSSISPPYTFCWTSRGIAGDNYYLRLWDSSGSGEYWYDAGANTCYTLNSLPSGWACGVSYYWGVGVTNNPQDGNDLCLSRYYRAVTLACSAASSAAADPAPQVRQLRPGASSTNEDGE
jgi:N-acetylneuraminic acid mutarotase